MYVHALHLETNMDWLWCVHVMLHPQLNYHTIIECMCMQG